MLPMPKLALALPILALSTAITGPVAATEQSDEADPVYVFNEVCYSKVPALDAIRDMATRLSWNPISGDDLKRFTALKNPDLLEGWDMQVGERLFRLGIVQSRPIESMAKTFPDFADGTATSCTLVLDGQDEAGAIAARMQSLAGKEPASRDVPEGELKTTTWAGGNADYKVFLFSKTDESGNGGLLNVTILAR